jgi:hypothetical protein
MELLLTFRNMALSRGFMHVIQALVCLYGVFFFFRSRPNMVVAPIASMTTFVGKLHLHDLAPYYQDDLRPLAQLCNGIRWDPKRVWKCDYASGGTSNVYNSVLGCVRAAIEAGATAFLPPQIWIRDRAEPVRVITGNRSDITDIGYLFDVPHFKLSLQTACPQMRIYSSIREVPNLPDDPHYALVRPTDFGGLPEWRKNLDNLLEGLGESAGGEYSHQTYDYVLMQKSVCTWPVWEDGEEFANNFKSILHSRPDARGLAAAVLDKMRSTFSTDGKPLRYYGAHLRTGDDLDPDWTRTGFEEQFKSYLTHATSAQVQLVYLGAGVPEDAVRFRERALDEYRVNVTTKREMLGSTNLRLLDAMTSDQQALIDFEVLSRADRVGGMHRSSFAWQLAFRKHTLSKLSLKDSLHDRPDIFQDEFSNILNTEPDKWFDNFFYGTWP